MFHGIRSKIFNAKTSRYRLFCTIFSGLTIRLGATNQTVIELRLGREIVPRNSICTILFLFINKQLEF